LHCTCPLSGVKRTTKGSRNKLSEDFIADLHESWLALGKAALVTAVRRYRFEVLRELVPKAGPTGVVIDSTRGSLMR
jgi:hypothetical protein